MFNIHSITHSITHSTIVDSMLHVWAGNFHLKYKAILLWRKVFTVYLIKLKFHHTGCIHITWASCGSCCWSIRFDVTVWSHVRPIRCQNCTGNFMLNLIVITALDSGNCFTIQWKKKSFRKYFYFLFWTMILYVKPW